jgi:hypothetical protein
VDDATVGPSVAKVGAGKNIEKRCFFLAGSA